MHKIQPPTIDIVFSSYTYHNISLPRFTLLSSYTNHIIVIIEFKHITALNLNILGKDNIIYVSLVNVTMYLNTIRKLNILNLKNGI